MHRRVAVTGVGVVSSIGLNANEFSASLAAGIVGIRDLDFEWVPELRIRTGGTIRGFTPPETKESDVLDPFAQYAVDAARQAVAQSGGAIEGDRTRIAVVTGSCLGGQSTEDRGFEEVYRQKRTRVHPMTIPRIMANAGASAVALKFGVHGPAYTISTACSSANHAIGHAFWLVRSGVVEAALAGGSEAPFSFGVLKAWDAMRVASPDTCRPFSRDRKGLILGEGGAMLVLEPFERARARGARILAEIVGFGMSSDAHHITQPLSDGAALAMRSALTDAEVAPEDVDYINAHGTGTTSNDVAETRAIRSVFGAHADRLAVSSTKAMHGHALGAAGAIEGAAVVLAMQSGIVPPTANYTAPDPECDLDVVPNQSRRLAIRHALSNSFAFGGLNAVLAFRAPES